MFISQPTLDDALHELLTLVTSQGSTVSSTKGDNIELLGVTVEIQNPRSRLSLTETRGKPFSCLGELLWYLSGSNRLDFIEYYIPEYAKYCEDDGTISGAYGPRIFGQGGDNQFQSVLQLLKRKLSSRQAVIQVFSSKDITTQKKDTPCTCTLQFFARDNKLHLVVSMRSNDAYLGFPHDMFAFSMIQEIMACALGLELGTYRHFSGSMHIYQKNVKDVRQFLGEGFQSTLSPMPSMPLEDGMSAIRRLLDIERVLRTGGSFSDVAQDFQSLPEYWQDICSMLRSYRLFQDGDLNGLKEVLFELHTDVFNTFIQRKIDALQANLGRQTN